MPLSAFRPATDLGQPSHGSCAEQPPLTVSLFPCRLSRCSRATLAGSSASRASSPTLCSSMSCLMRFLTLATHRSVTLEAVKQTAVAASWACHLCACPLPQTRPRQTLFLTPSHDSSCLCCLCRPVMWRTVMPVLCRAVHARGLLTVDCLLRTVIVQVPGLCC